VTASEGEDHRILLLDLAQLALCAGLVGELEVGKGRAGRDVGTHLDLLVRS